MILKKDNKIYVKPDTDKSKIGRINQSLPDYSVFDRIYCIHYLPYTDRLENIKRELIRIGIPFDRLEFYWTTPNKYYELLFYSDSHIDIPSVNITNINYTVNSYNLMKQIYDLGYERVLIIEDDIAALKDVSVIAEHIRAFPSDYDLTMFEYFVYSKDKDFKKAYDTIISRNKTVNDHYVEFTNETIYDTGMFALSRKMVKHIIDGDDTLLKPFDGYTRRFSSDDGLKRCISKRPLCIQRQYTTQQDSHNIFDKYAGIVRRADYAV